MRESSHFYEFIKKKRAIVDLPKYNDALKKAEINLYFAKQDMGAFAGKKVKEAEEKIKQLRDYIEYLEKLNSSNNL